MHEAADYVPCPRCFAPVGAPCYTIGRGGQSMIHFRSVHVDRFVEMKKVEHAKKREKERIRKEYERARILAGRKVIRQHVEREQLLSEVKEVTCGC